MQIVVQGLLTHYECQGSGKAVLLLHGWADSLDTFKLLVAVLSKSQKVISVDLPGFGQSQTPKSAWKLDNYSEFLKDFLYKLNILDIYCIIGHSNGGALAIRALVTEQITADKLVLIAASGVRNSDDLKRKALQAVTKTGKVMTFWLPVSSKQKLQKRLYGAIGSDMLIAPHMQETFRQIVRQDIQTDASSLAIPTLLIYGDQDKATPLKSIGQKLHTLIKYSRLEIIPNAAHFVHQTDSGQVNRLIAEFLK